MKTFSSYLEDVKWNKRLKQKDLAKILGVTESSISRYLSGKDIPDDEKCIILAEYVGDDPFTVITIAHTSIAKDEKTRKVWEDIAKKLACSIAFMMLLASNANASTLQSSKCVFQNDDLSIMRHRKTRRRHPRLIFLPA